MGLLICLWYRVVAHSKEQTVAHNFFSPLEIIAETNCSKGTHFPVLRQMFRVIYPCFASLYFNSVEPLFEGHLHTENISLGSEDVP